MNFKEIIEQQQIAAQIANEDEDREKEANINWWYLEGVRDATNKSPIWNAFSVTEEERFISAYRLGYYDTAGIELSDASDDERDGSTRS